MIDRPILSRHFTVDGSPVECRFFLPDYDGQDYACRYEIIWPDKPRSRRVYGVDGVQALLLAMQGAHLDLLLARQDKGMDVQWLDGPNLGLPISRALRDMDPDGDF